MNLFAGNILFAGKKEILEQEFETLVIPTSSGDTLVFLLWEIDTDDEQELRDFLAENFGEWKEIDVSFSAVDAIELLVDSYEDGVYELVSFEGESVIFDEICERFAQADGAILVREAETSRKYGNKIVKVEFIY